MKNEKGQSLAELILAFGVVSIVIVSVVGLMTKSVSNLTFSRNKSLATRMAYKTMEWIRTERDNNWQYIYSRSATSSGITYCVVDSVLIHTSWPPSAGSCSSTQYVTGTNFRREVNLTITDIAYSTVRSRVTVFWSDAQGTHQIVSESLFTNWQGI